MLFTERFHQCFIPEVKEYLEDGELLLKLLLIIDNAPGHPHSISIEDENIQVVFSPLNTTSLLQPLHQVIIRRVNASYTSQVFEMFRVVIDTEQNLQVMDCWKYFSIADAINFIKAAMDKVNPGRVNACWKNLWSEAVNDFKGFTGIDEEINKTIQTARDVCGEGFVHMIDEEAE